MSSSFPPTGQLDSFHRQRGFVFHNPFNGLALFDFQRLSQRGWTDQIELALASGSFNHLDFGLISHAALLRNKMWEYHTIAISLVKSFFDFFTASPFKGDFQRRNLRFDLDSAGRVTRASTANNYWLRK
jgi:hypothetical protein